jgi:5'-nucleotidase
MELRHIGGRRDLVAQVRPRRPSPPYPRHLARALAGVAVASCLAGAAPGCTSGGVGVQSPCPAGATCDVHLTLLHTSDIHSRIFPYDLQILQVDSELGLGTLAQVKNVGGVARLSYLLNRERARADRVLHVDSGDIFEGAPIFNFFKGEPETRSSDMMGTDVMVIGNHEFDDGAINAVRQMRKWASFPLLAANYTFQAPGAANNTGLDTVLKPFALFNLEGLKVGVIGMANFSSLSSTFDQPNSLGIQVLNTVETAQAYVDLLRPMVDVVVVLSHLGLDVDEHMVQNTTGIDVVEGGHNHIVINPPQTMQDCSSDPTHPGYVWSPLPNVAYDPQHPVWDPADTDHLHPNETRRLCKPRNVLISHSGAFAKYMGRLDLVLSNNPAEASPTGDPKDYDPVNGFEVVSSSYVPYPVDDAVPEDPRLVDLLQPYQRVLDRVADLNVLAGFSPNGANRIAPQGGDSPLGNLIADAMWLRLGVQTDFSLTNSTGIRTDLIPGPVTIEEMYNIFPFDNTITKMSLSGLEVQEMFDFVARRSEGRGCTSQAQIAGARVILNCAGCSRPGAHTTCTQDADCIGAEVGSCDLSKGSPGMCIVTACADQIFIGHLQNACAKDDDCPDKLPGQCDLAGGTLATGTCSAPVVEKNVYDFATSNYLAAGGSGFRVLQRNTTQINTQIEQRDALVDFMRNGHPCGYSSAYATTEGLLACTRDADCAQLGSFVCACPGQVRSTGSAATQTCVTTGTCSLDAGRCVRSDCRDQVATFHEKSCTGTATPSQCNTDLDACSLAGEECKLLSCIDATLGATTDNRVQMTGR